MLSNSALDFNVSLQQTENSCDILKEMENILPHFSRSKNWVLKQTDIKRLTMTHNYYENFFIVMSKLC
jgi:hypothetical protein